MNKGNSEDIGTTDRKSEGTYYRRSGVTPAEGRSPGKITLGGEMKCHGSNRDLRYDGHETEEDSVAFRTYWRRASMG
jgi:hypothetical protein